MSLSDFLEDIAPLVGPAPKEPKVEDEEDEHVKAPKSAKEKALAKKHPSLFAAAPGKNSFIRMVSLWRMRKVLPKRYNLNPPKEPDR